MAHVPNRAIQIVTGRPGIVATVAGAAWAQPVPAAAYHDTIGVGGGAPVHVLVVLVVAVALGMVALSYWKPGKRKSRSRPSSQTVRPAAKKRRRRAP